MPLTPPPASGSSRPAAMLAGFALTGLLVLIAGILPYRAASEFARANRMLVQTYSALESIGDIQTGYLSASNFLRGYIVSGDARAPVRYHEGLDHMRAALKRTRELLAADPVDGPMLDALETALDVRERSMRDTEAVAAKGSAAVMARVNVTTIQAEEAAIGAVFSRLKARHQALIAEQADAVDARLSTLRFALLVFFVTSAVLLTLLFLRARAHAARRDVAVNEMERQRRISDSIVENAPMGVFLKETEGFTLVRVNRFIEEIAGRSRAQMLGKDDSQFVGADLARQLIQAERELVERRQMLSFEEVQIDTTRGKRTLHMRKVLIPDEHGQIRYVLGLSEDVTDRRRAEQGQREFAETLERKSRELESANKELESFSYSVSHDLRAPLRAVEGYAVILEEDYGPKLDDEGRRFLHNIREGATRMGHLIQDLLAFSRLSRQPLSPVDTDTRLLVQSAWQAIRAAQPTLTAELVVTDLPPSWGDARLLQQVWTNLLENAVKYSSKVSAPRIVVSGETDGQEALFQIQDNGVGFDMRYYDKLFNVFQRLHSESEYSGTGVGLAIVHRVIARHGGRVWARSEPGKGATFSFALPFKPVD